MELDIRVQEKKERERGENKRKRKAPQEFKVGFWFVLDPCPVSAEHSGNLRDQKCPQALEWMTRKYLKCVSFYGEFNVSNLGAIYNYNKYHEKLMWPLQIQRNDKV